MRVPEDFEKRMRDMLGAEYDEFAEAIDQKSVFAGIRLNPLKENACDAVRKEFGEMKKIPWCDEGFYADKNIISGNHPYHIAGLFYFQEPSAMCAVSALPIERGDYILDLCAAPGGKATQAGALLCGTGLIVANEIVKNRANILSDNIARMGIRNAIVTNEKPQRLAEKYPRFFDKIVVDAPCSGEGMFRKEPQAVDEWSVEHTRSCSVRQRHILDCAMKMLKKGGHLVYSTCTFAPEENEMVCAYLLENYDVELVEPQKLNMLCAGKSEWSGSEHDMSKTRRIFPHKQDGEGHFTALFHLKGGEDIKESSNDRIVKKKISNEEKLYREFEKSFLNVRLDGEFCVFGENLYLKPRGIDIDKIKTLRAGLHLGICRKNRFEPSHALCVALKREDFKNAVSLAARSGDLKKYLRGETIECEKKGWCVVCADDYPIGWGKASGGILKNHFPKFMRIKN